YPECANLVHSGLGLEEADAVARVGGDRSLLAEHEKCSSVPQCSRHAIVPYLRLDSAERRRSSSCSRRLSAAGAPASSPCRPITSSPRAASKVALAPNCPTCPFKVWAATYTAWESLVTTAVCKLASIVCHWVEKISINSAN